MREPEHLSSKNDSDHDRTPLSDRGAPVAAFDFDGTLTDRGSVWQFLVSVTGWPRVVFAAVSIAPRLALAALVGGRYADEAKEALFRRTLSGLSLEELAPQAVSFGLSHYRAHARSDLRARLEWHLSRGHRVVIVSASPEIYVRPVGTHLGALEVLATRLEVDGSGVLTGNYDGRNCRGSEKLERLRAWMGSPQAVPPGGASGEDAVPFLWAYGNSAGDRSLLAAADVAIDAGRLGRFGRLRRFHRLAEVSYQ